METAISTLSVLPSTKEEIKNFTAMVLAELESGTVDELPFAIKLTAYEKMIKDIKDNSRYKDIMRVASEQHGTNLIEMHNAKIELAEVGIKYDYSVCNDSVYNSLKEDESKIKEMIKARESMLKTGINPETGEEFIKPVKTSTSSIKITLK